jgi:bacteriorhodopsin
MINNSVVAKTIYGSLVAQLITTIISLDGLNYDLPIEDTILKDILILEAFVQFVEAFFYIWVIYALKDLNKMTSRRYIDWFITTPTMLISTIIFMEYLRKKEKNEDTLNFWAFLKDHKKNIILIIFLNFSMLLCGLLSETRIIDKKYGISLGFVFFIASFYVIYENYAKHTEGSKKLFMFLFIVWSLYGFAAIMPIVQKNICYNILDIIAKNFYGLFIYCYITRIGSRKGIH